MIATAHRLSELATSLAPPPLPAEQSEAIFERAVNGAWLDDRARKKDLRRLPWLLSGGDPPLYTRGGFEKVKQRLSVSLSGLRLKGLIYSCIMMPAEFAPDRIRDIAEMISQAIEAEVMSARHNGKRPNMFLAHWKEWSAALYPDRAEDVATRLLRGSVNNWIQILKLPLNSPRVGTLLRPLARAAGAGDDARVQELLASVEQSHDVTTKAIVLGEVLSSRSTTNRTAIDRNVLNFALRHFDDPRVDSKGRWSRMPEAARRLVSRWVSEEDLKLFFTHLGGDEKSERRKRYWLKFIEGGRINFSRIFFSPDDYNSLPGKVKAEAGLLSRHTQFSRNASSAFLLGIDDYFIVEFKLTGNATYVYSKTKHPKSLLQDGGLKSHNELKDAYNHADKISHIGAWEEEFDNRLGRLLRLAIPPTPGVTRSRPGYRY